MNRVVRARERGFALPSGDRRWPGPLAVVLGGAACALVVIAAAGEPLRRADRRWARLALSPWLLAIPVGVVVVLGLVALTNARPAGGGRTVRRRASWLTILGFVAVAVLFSHVRPEAGQPKSPTGELEIGPTTPAEPGHGTGWPTWMAIAAGGAVAVAALGCPPGHPGGPHQRTPARPTPTVRSAPSRTPWPTSASRATPGPGSSPPTAACSTASTTPARAGGMPRPPSSTSAAPCRRSACDRSRCAT